jgi:hypothetical protein
MDAPTDALRALLGEPRPTPERVAALLDELNHDARVAALRGLRSSQLRTLFDLVAGFAALGPDDLVPPKAAPYTVVRHIGRNSLPLFSAFEKRFYRTGVGSEIAGANFQTMSPVTGPGYFMVRQDAARSEILIDYEQLPAQAPADWPAICSNDTGVSRLVYGHMLDTLRRVSRHVTIGSAARKGKAVDAYFALCRED